MTIALDDPRAADVRALLEAHLAFNRAASPPEDVHALDVDELCAPDVLFFSARDDSGALLGVGALRRLDDEHGEIKSMHTLQRARKRGVARMMLEHLVETARRDGCTRVSLETGSMDEFAPARALYTSAGFVECEPFGDYGPSVNSTFMTRCL